ncbi:hypothetical protein EJB05_04051, partial [Eragrostis curvula]
PSLTAPRPPPSTAVEFPVRKTSKTHRFTSPFSLFLSQNSVPHRSRTGERVLHPCCWKSKEETTPSSSNAVQSSCDGRRLKFPFVFPNSGELYSPSISPSPAPPQVIPKLIETLLDFPSHKFISFIQRILVCIEIEQPEGDAGTVDIEAEPGNVSENPATQGKHRCISQLFWMSLIECA